jgi:hypothetical protein
MNTKATGVITALSAESLLFGGHGAMNILTKQDPYKHTDGRYRHDVNTSHHPTGTDDFIAIDGEGVTLPNGEHRYVLLGVGQEQIEDSDGLQWQEIFEFIESQWTPRVAFVGFYLGYDFTMWLKTLPEERARRLLTIEGRESRRSKSPKLRGKILPVDLDGWQVDILGSKRLAFRRKECDCETVKCEHPKGRWIYVSDAGAFFQTSFLNVINPDNWQHPIVTDDEYATILAGKEQRSTAILDADMRRYNRLENDVMGRVMRDLNDGFRKLDVALPTSSWYGPGQAAQAWMRGRAPKREEVEATVPEWFSDAARKSYFGGWFEQQAHGLIPGESYEYDINSAYPAIIATLPCLLHGTYDMGTGKPNVKPEELCLVRALVWGQAPHSDATRGHSLGAMLHRDSQGRICRPLITEGWFWWHELQAAATAKCVIRTPPKRYYEWVKYTPCDCPPPLWQVKHLYQMRLDVGKKSSLSKAAKLVANSLYGKTAQSVGSPLYANPVYASLITAGCRTMILDAIATHPKGKQNVVMVATDAVFFLDPHPLLPNGPSLGEWETKERTNLTLFKPGVYWDDEARAAIAAGTHPTFKARGVNARDFAGTIRRIDKMFAQWGDNPPPITDATFKPEEMQAMGFPSWPKVTFTSGFAMTTALQALVRHEWGTAGAIDTAKPLVQNANPEDKRDRIWLDLSTPDRPIYRSEPHEVGVNAVYRTIGNVSLWGDMVETYTSVPYEKRFGLEDPFSDENSQAFGVTPDAHQPYRSMFRLLTGQE